MKLELLTAALAATSMLATLGVAGAHGPTRQKISEKIEINAPPDKVWAVVSNFQDGGWIPVVAKTEGTGGNAPGAKRTLTLKNGATVEEEVAKFEPEKMTLMYRIEKVDVAVLPVTNYSSWLIVTPADGGAKSEVEWRGAFYRGYPNNDPPPELNDEAAVNAVTGLYKAGLGELKKQIEGGS
ncbi:polyketide cyclase/dehydrase/lipid transport protein [Ancylobacter aquaticus]|uniref:Polyketide cyclase/dehydrase/lipid transport protein n=1 Tax=Ancylobacter aquaticus TaxID=100 RepID=A0A4R1IE59_ANCAQ|nr:SRPBCC family protein [Ancylobacter aquaticus]TCK29072.1 polyketide cyclase/dehydrase/lipid transport protein [Ancylobacter aquaticus]